MMVKKTALPFGLILLVAIAAPAQLSRKHANAVLPLTSKSPEAHRIARQAMERYLDKVQQAEAIEDLRKAVTIDPDFAIAHEFLAQISLDPGEQVSEQQKAFATRKYASPGEQLAIEWYQDAMDHKLMPAIVKMNDLLRQYPRDKWVVWMTTWWLMTETQYQRAIEVYERSGIADSLGLMNNMGYAYASLRQFDKAFALMNKYAEALPHDPNPQDSYAEILRMAGQFEQSIAHYRAALAIDSKFYSSEFGIADTYSLMGDQVQARKQYEAAFREFPALPELHRIQWKTREAITYVREADYENADRAFHAIAAYAHSKHMSQVEADSYRQMALYQPDAKHALALLKKARRTLAHRRNAAPLLVKQESAQILRARVEAALKTGDKKLVNRSLAQLAKLSQSSDDKLIDVEYHGAAGAVAFAQNKNDDAISHLEEDTDNPSSLQLLAAAYHRVGNRADAQTTSETLANLNEPTVEQALIVPAFRACYKDPACSGDTRTGEQKQSRRSRPMLM